MPSVLRGGDLHPSPPLRRSGLGDGDRAEIRDRIALLPGALPVGVQHGVVAGRRWSAGGAPAARAGAAGVEGRAFPALALQPPHRRDIPRLLHGRRGERAREIRGELAPHPEGPAPPHQRATRVQLRHLRAASALLAANRSRRANGTRAPASSWDRPGAPLGACGATRSAERRRSPTSSTQPSTTRAANTSAPGNGSSVPSAPSMTRGRDLLGRSPRAPRRAPAGSGGSVAPGFPGG